MQLGVIGLGRMGANIARRLARNGHEMVVYDLDPKTVEALAGEGMTASKSLADMVSKLEAPRSIWVMLPAGKITEDTILDLANHLDKGDTVIDGGNTMYKDDIRRAKILREKGQHYVDVGTSAASGASSAVIA
jgi:6-phosphogluconate dehydrogenase (decarboxylating) (EC 1.1.1.44)